VQWGPHDFTIANKKRNTVYNANLSPSMLKDQYGLSQSLTAGAGKTIAIIGAFAHPNIEADLAIFSQYYNLPPCTTANGCFRRVSQTGSTTEFTSATDQGWAQEASLDVQWAHAVAPGANILYVEAYSDSSVDLFPAARYASNNADYVSMSFGIAESAGTLSYESIFSNKRVSFFASSGDTGAGVNYPAASPHVIGVGGTTLYTSDPADQTFGAEYGWSGSGGGCSVYFQATSAQAAKSSSVCGEYRAVPDVAFNANPSSGVLVYVSEGCNDPQQACWYTMGGTSLAAPIMAARSASSGELVNSASLYTGSNVYRDIVHGNNGYPCEAGFDLVTGMGPWLGSASSSASGSPSNSATVSPTSSATTASNSDSAAPVNPPTPTASPISTTGTRECSIFGCFSAAVKPQAVTGVFALVLLPAVLSMLGAL
jgi:subtilase family serine protease